MADFTIVVRRQGKGEGWLEFQVGGATKFKTRCWEHPDKLIPAKTYTCCSTTTMVTKGYKAVYIPDEQTGRRGIFVHQGSKPEHSDGCIVCASLKVSEIWDAAPRNARNIEVQVIG